MVYKAVSAAKLEASCEADLRGFSEGDESTIGSANDGFRLAGSVAGWEPGARASRVCVHHVISLLDAAARQLPAEQAAQGAILEAASLLRKQIDPRDAAADASGRLLAWQARKVRGYIDAHLTGPVRVADLCALIQRSAAHFSRAFKCTFGVSPHAFVIQRRLELAARFMLEADARLSDIALRCGFADQAHLCKHFRQSTGRTPAAWRRARRAQDLESSVSRLSTKGCSWANPNGGSASP